jgi:hypothetical protein
VKNSRWNRNGVKQFTSGRRVFGYPNGWKETSFGKRMI